MNIRTKIISLMIVISMFVGISTACVSDYRTQITDITQATPFVKESMLMNIEFRPNVVSTTDVTIYKNPNVNYKNIYINDKIIITNDRITTINNECDKNNKGKVGYALAGFAHNGASYEHLITQIFSEHNDISTIIVPDLPGHGNSTMPTNMLFGDLTINDYININKLILEKLNEKRIYPEFGIFHSQAGLVAMMLQEQVNLKTYGIKNVILIAPAPPQEVNWSFLSKVDPYMFLNYLVIDNNGAYFNIPTMDWIGFFFSNPYGSISQNLPTMDNVEKYKAKAPLISTLQLIGIKLTSLNPPIFELDNSLRINVSKGLFSEKNSPKLWMILYGNDTIVSKDDGINTYNHLISVKYDKNKPYRFYVQETYKQNKYITCDKHTICNKHIIYVPNAVHDYHLVMNIEEINKII